MTADEFRELALSFPEACESSHMGHPDFRVRGKIFATLWPDEQYGMVKLMPDDQAIVCRGEPAVFAPVKGGWGKRGSTTVLLAKADEASVRGALLAAWRKAAPKRLGDAFAQDEQR